MARIAALDIDWKPDRESGVPVTEQIVDYMCRQVSDGAWPIGSRLPSQRALADAFGVNRSTIIAAINELTDYGIVEGRHGAGTTIVSNTWSLMLPGAPQWADYVSSGFFKANNATIQSINHLEFAPDITRIGTGELDPRLFPKAMWHRVLTEAANEIDALGYPPPEGEPALREAIAAHMCATGIQCTPAQVLITSGALQALQMISVSLLPDGSTVYAEAPSYIKSLQVFQSAGMKLQGMPMDHEGISVAALHRMLSGDATLPNEMPLNGVLHNGAPFNDMPSNSTPLGGAPLSGVSLDGISPSGAPSNDAPHNGTAQNSTPPHETAVSTAIPPRGGLRQSTGGAILYTIPTNHNPTGITMTAERRRDLIDCCVANRLPIIEDGAYRDLCFDGEAPLPLKTLDETGMVITLGSASKALAPGLRIGWIVASEPIVQRLADVKMQMDYGASVLSQWAFTRFLTSGLYDQYLASLKLELRRRRDCALATLQDTLADRAQWTKPIGGFYIWLTFKHPMRMSRVFQLAAEHGVLLNPGDIYDFEANNSLRLSYSYTTPEEFRRAVETLAGVVRELED